MYKHTLNKTNIELIAGNKNQRSIKCTIKCKQIAVDCFGKSGMVLPVIGYVGECSITKLVRSI